MSGEIVDLYTRQPIAPPDEAKVLATLQAHGARGGWIVDPVCGGGFEIRSATDPLWHCRVLSLDHVASILRGLGALD